MTRFIGSLRGKHRLGRLSVLHRLFPSGSDRAAKKWKETIDIGGIEEIQLHHLYRAVAWLGEALPEDQKLAATTLVTIVDRLRSRFSIGRICIVADWGMIRTKTIEELASPQRRWQYILGARMRKQQEVSGQVLSRAGRYQTVHPPRTKRKDPSPLKVKEVVVEGRRYVVCLNDEEARKDAHDRQWIVASLRQH